MSIQALEHQSFDPEIISCFSQLLSYPTENYKEVAEKCFKGLNGDLDFKLFFDFISQLELDEIQAVYTEMFELNFHISPYVGYYLFGESYLRSTFLVELKSRFKKFDFLPEKELPDHFAVILEFVSKFPSTALADELVGSALIPSLKRIIWTKIRPEDKPATISAGLAFYSLLLSLYNYLSKPADEIHPQNTISLPVQSSPVPDNSGIDQWIRKGKKKED